MLELDEPLGIAKLWLKKKLVIKQRSAELTVGRARKRLSRRPVKLKYDEFKLLSRCAHLKGRDHVRTGVNKRRLIC